MHRVVDRMVDIDAWYLENLVDPVDQSSLSAADDHLVSKGGRRYPVVEGVPVMLVPDVEQTIGIAGASLRRANGDAAVVDGRAPQFYLETLGISEDEKRLLIERAETGASKIDPVVSVIIGATSGYAYKHLIGSETFADYPIPAIGLPKSSGDRLLDIGCNWGRWSIAAARAGYKAVGLDPSLGAIMAARRIANQLSLDIKFVVGDGRWLPFAAGSFETVYSYSVIQHFSRIDARKALAEVARVLKDGGLAKIQMANAYGLRSLQHQFRRRFQEPADFDVRYYSVSELQLLFEQTIGKTSIRPDCYFGLGWQWVDYKLLPPTLNAILVCSEALKQLSDIVPSMRSVADSVFCEATKGA